MRKDAVRSLLLGLVLCVLATLPGLAMADDWRQFRHDERRTGVSADRLPPPLTDIWSWEPGALKSSRPFGAPSVWQGRLYTFSHENTAPTLLCVDTRTNVRIWQQPLGAGFESTYARKDVGPAIGPDGVVYTYGRSQYVVPPDEALRLKQSGQDAPPVFPLVNLRAFRGLDGLLMAQHPLPVGYPLREQNDYIFRTFLWDEPGVTLGLPPGALSHVRLAGTVNLGPPLVIGGVLMAASSGDLLLEWTPGARARYTRVAHRYDHPILELTPPAKFLGCTMTATTSGAVVGDDRVFRWFGNLTATGRMNWHWDIPWSFGVPSTRSGRIYLNVGGMGARNGVVCLNEGNGAPEWMYPVGGPLPDTFNEEGWQEKGGAAPFLDGVLLGAGDSPSGLPSYIYSDPWHTEPPLRWMRSSQSWSVLPDPFASKDRSKPKQPSRYSALELLQHVQFSGPRGHLTNQGVIVQGQRVFAMAMGALNCLDADKGNVIWRRKWPDYHPITALMASKDYLVIVQDQGTLPTYAPTLWVLDPNSGRLVWSTSMPHGGPAAIAHGMLFVSGKDTMTAWAPGERTFRVAVDSADPADYLTDAGNASQSPAAAPELENEDPDKPKPPRELGMLISEARPPTPIKAVADAGMVRLRYGQANGELVRQAAERRRILPDRPLLVALDWLAPDRRSRIAGTAAGEWSPEQRKEFASLCGEIAGAAHPEHFEIGSDLNVYLTTHSNAFDSVRELIVEARDAIKKASPKTRVLISYNAEVFTGWYGRTTYKPFGDLPDRDPQRVKRHLELIPLVDEMGLTCLPRSGFIDEHQISYTYLTDLRKAFGGTPVVMTRISVDANGEPGVGPETQRRFLKRVVQAVYWLDSPLIAYPDPGKLTESASPQALRGKEGERPALEVWKDLLRWKPVKELTAAKPEMAT